MLAFFIFPTEAAGKDAVSTAETNQSFQKTVLGVRVKDGARVAVSCTLFPSPVLLPRTGVWVVVDPYSRQYDLGGTYTATIPPELDRGGASAQTDVAVAAKR